MSTFPTLPSAYVLGVPVLIATDYVRVDVMLSGQRIGGGFGSSVSEAQANALASARSHASRKV